MTIALVGKYTDMQDSYMSVVKSLEHSAFRCNRRLILKVRPISTCSTQPLNPARRLDSGSMLPTLSPIPKLSALRSTTMRGKLLFQRGTLILCVLADSILTTEPPVAVYSSPVVSECAVQRA